MSESVRWAVALLVAFSLALTAGSATADTGTVLCGTLQALRWPNGLAGTAGEATIDGRTYELRVSWSSRGINKIGRAATTGSQVCLSGDLVPNTTDIVTNFVLDACGSCTAVAEAGLGPAGVDGDPVPFGIAALAAVGSLTAVLAGRRRRSTDVAIRGKSVGRIPAGRVPAIGVTALSGSRRQQTATPDARDLVLAAGRLAGGEVLPRDRHEVLPRDPHLDRAAWIPRPTLAASARRPSVRAR